MTNDLPPRDAPPPSEHRDRYEGAGRLLLAIAATMGALRAVAILSAGLGLVPAVEAAYALLLHVGVGGLVAASLALLGDWLGLAERRARTAPKAEREPTTVEAPAPEPVLPEDPARWRARLLAAREANDAARVLEIRGEAPDEVDDRELAELDADLGKWLLGLVHRRLRSGPLQADLVGLVERGSEAFGHTKEGASLRAALPTLRRGAGLCPRCARPYGGVWEACPECMGRPEPPPPELPGLAPADEYEEEDERGYGPRSVDGRWFVDPDDEADPRGRPGG